MNPPGLRKLLRGFEAALITAMVACVFPTLAAKTPDPLQTAFATPPDSAKPQVWWHWMDGNITKEGITADLEAMQRVGIGGATIINVAYGIPPGPVKFMSEAWRELVRHAVSEGKRLGLEIGIANCDGYSSSGGPWITPEYSMQQVVSSETQVKGGAAFSGTLAQPLTHIGYYRDIAVLAFPTPQGEQVKMSDAAPQATASANAADASRVLDGKPETYLTLPLPSPGQPQSVEFSFPQPFTAQALNVQGVMGPDVYMYGFSGYLEASNNGKMYRKIRDISYPEGRSRQPFGFAPVTARFFRLVITSAGRRSDKLALAELELSQRASMDNRTFKTDEQSNGTKALAPIVSAQPLPEQIIGLQNIVDLTSKLSPNGASNWQVPEGDWTILRIGHTSTGVVNHPATPGGRGLETDKLNPAATELHWNAMMTKVVKDNQPLVKKTFTHVLIDSYEVDSQNWTPRFREEFQKRHGYDLTPYLPALSGRFVGSPEMTDRFLWDLRRTVADLFSEAYFGRMADLAHRDGLLAAYEPYGNGPFDSITSGGKADIPMGEFWAGGNAGPVLKMAASVAHLYGRGLAGAEAFTATPQNGRWQQDPFSLKAVGDAAFCQGINHLSIHRYAHQPWLDRFPGMTMGPWGTHFERTLTWWNQGAGWITYLARCQAMLQRGQFVGDILCFAGEHSPNEIPNFQSQIPSGYDYDVCNTEVLLQLQVRDGVLQAPHGMQYRLLVLPNQTRVTPVLARKIKELVATGATVIGPRPVRSPSLEDYPQCDEEVAAIGREVWGDATGKTRHEFGTGKVIWGEPLEAVLQSDGIKPDFVTANGKGGFHTIHRRNGAADIYFVANPTETAVDGTCTFRVSGKIPELWKPDTGAVGKAPVYSTEADGRVTVPLHFEPAGSVFVVFRQKEANADHAVAVARTDAGPFTKSQAPGFELSAGESGLPNLKAWQPGTYAVTLASGKTVKADLSKMPAPLTVSGPWKLAFPPNGGAPASLTLEQLGSWTDQPDAGVRYFSGTATYRKEIDIPQALLGSGKLLRLDLGRVKNLAQVIFNGKDLGVLWKPPFTVDIGPLARPGKNMLEVRVTNLWVNRLIGDEQLPADCQWKTRRERGKALQEWPQWLLEGKPSPTERFTFTTWQHWTKEDAPLESGLLGPVTLQPGLVVPVP